MAGLVADNDVGGQFDDLASIFLSEEWRGFWLSLNLSVETFASLGLTEDSKDIDVWKVCQKNQVMLVTGNRNSEDPDSLDAVIRTLNQPDSLPVFTLADPTRIKKQRAYAKKVAERLLDYLLEFESLRGTGRIYVP